MAISDYQLPMQANKVDIEAIPRKCAGYVMEPKLDGWRCITYIESHRVTMLSRTGKPFHEKVPHIVEQLQHLPDCVLDGELGYVDDNIVTVWPVFDYPTTASVLGSGIDEALRKQDTLDHNFQYLLFDMPSEPGSQEVRRHHLEDLYWDHIEADEWTTIELVDQYGSWKENWYEDYVLNGGEGVMLKNPNGTYCHSKRPANNWYKVKKFETETVTITDMKQGQGKYSDMIGALYWCAEDGTRGWCSGMTDDERRDMTLFPSKYIGEKMDIRHFGRVGKDQEGVRHPQFIRMRPDLEG
jgi:ATP-dependent DNA ligase